MRSAAEQTCLFVPKGGSEVEAPALRSMRRRSFLVVALAASLPSLEFDEAFGVAVPTRPSDPHVCGPPQ